MYVVAKELVGVPGMPATTKGIREALKRYASGEDNFARRRPGTKAIEYSVNCLPEVTQKAVRERYVAQLMENEPQEPVKPVVRRRHDPDAISPLEAYRGSPQLMEESLNALTEKQRQIADARAMLVVEVLRLEVEGGLSRIKAIQHMVSAARAGTLPTRLMKAVRASNSRYNEKRSLSRRPLNDWVLAYVAAENAAEKLLTLAPKKREAVKVEEISWLPDFMAQYRQSNGRPMTEAYEDFVAEWNRRYAEEPYMLQIIPSYDAIRRVMKKLPEVVKQKGRITGSEYRQLEGFTRRDWSKAPVNYVWIGDGHGMKMKCAHPIHGRPFSPEVTFVIDGGTRFVVGWSLDLAENVFAVAGA
ncbi:transposase, partial [Salmonella enterica subsp. enterica serovar Chandans]|nr:transposase [Salmonella enterica subsp. enterica serovar Chandans]